MTYFSLAAAHFCSCIFLSVVSTFFFYQIIFKPWPTHSTVSQVIVLLSKEEAVRHNARPGVMSGGETEEMP